MTDGGVAKISREQLRERIESGAEGGGKFYLLEVLSEESYRKAHLPGAMRFTEIERAEELLPEKDAEVITYCSKLN